MSEFRVESMFKEGHNGETWDYYVGKQVLGSGYVESIEYHSASGEGDAHYCDIYYCSGNFDRVFRPDSIEFKKEVLG